MEQVRVAENGRTFTRGGKPFFYLADTIWSAFTNVTDSEWDYYLSVRAEQGFNALQINILPQWDRSIPDLGLYPFASRDGGQTFDFSVWNEEYFSHAKRMCRAAADAGFTLALVVKWANFVTSTWASSMKSANEKPEEMLEEYATKVAAEFDEFHPIYVVSGDTDLDTSEAVRYYDRILSTLCEKSPDTLKTMHVKRGYDHVPENLAEKLDYFLFQSGHNGSAQVMAWRLPQIIGSRYPGKPLVNAEPCYEQMGYSHNEYGRFNPWDIRRAAWCSILSGASAGVTYGAHGIWNWNRADSVVNPIMGEGFDRAQSWNDALHFPGAWDYGRIRVMAEGKDFIPCQDLLDGAGASPQIRLARAGEEYWLYVPYNTAVKIRADLSGYGLSAFDLAQKRIAHLSLAVTDGVTRLSMHPFQEDALMILTKEE